MLENLKSLLAREDGAITVDWVVLSAAIVSLAAGSGAAIVSATNSMSSHVSGELTSSTVDNGD